MISDRKKEKGTKKEEFKSGIGREKRKKEAKAEGFRLDDEEIEIYR